MKVAIVGSRGINDYGLVRRKIIQYFWHEYTSKPLDFSIVSGGARGVDALAKRFAEEFSIPIEEVKPDWEQWGKSAGIRRNIEIIRKCDVVLILWDGISKGTRHDIEEAYRQKKDMILITKIS